MSGNEPRGLKSVPYEGFIFLVSLLSLVNVGVAIVAVSRIPVPGSAAEVVLLVDLSLTPLYLGDFLYRLASSHPRRDYFLNGLGWLDLLAVIPILRILRIARIFQVGRWFKRMGRRRVVEQLADQRAATTFLLTIFLVFVVVEIAGTTVFAVEGQDPSANIHSPGDAIWWGLVTITTVGYGDQYPVTPEGRVIGVFLLFAGVGLFSVLTGFIANVFLAPRRRLLVEPEDPRSAIGNLRTLLHEQQDRETQILRHLDELERMLERSPDGVLDGDGEVPSG